MRNWKSGNLTGRDAHGDVRLFQVFSGVARCGARRTDLAHSAARVPRAAGGLRVTPDPPSGHRSGPHSPRSRPGQDSPTGLPRPATCATREARSDSHGSR